MTQPFTTLRRRSRRLPPPRLPLGPRSPAPAGGPPPIERLALSFPSLHRAVGITPWDAAKLDAWVSGPWASEAARHAARFVLAVWDRRQPWHCGPFDAVAALAVWDAPHRGAFLTWVARPWRSS